MYTTRTILQLCGEVAELLRGRIELRAPLFGEAAALHQLAAHEVQVARPLLQLLARALELLRLRWGASSRGSWGPCRFDEAFGGFGQIT